MPLQVLYRRFIILSFLTLMAVFLQITSTHVTSAQGPTPTPHLERKPGVAWLGEKVIKERTSDIMARQRAKDAQHLPKTPKQTKPLHIDNRSLPQDARALNAATSTTGVAQVSTLNPAQAIGVNFAGPTLYDSTEDPPDSMGAIGPTQFTIAVNGRIRVYDKNTGSIGPLDADLSAFLPLSITALQWPILIYVTTASPVGGSSSPSTWRQPTTAF